MVIALVVILLVAAAALLAWKRRKSGWVCFALAVLVLVLAGTGLVARPALEALQSGHADAFSDWGARNVLVLLGVGTARTPDGDDAGIFAFGRIAKTAELYRSCKASGKACKIIVSGGKGNTLEVAGQQVEAPLYARHLAQLGVAPDDVILESKSRNTWENAKYSCALLDKQHADRVVLVSSAVHLRRSQLYFGHFCGHADGVRADYLDVGVLALPTSLNVLLTDVALHEYTSLWRFKLSEAMGTNEKPGS